MKNKMMRIASILLVATLLTTCAISGTFAKYVTKASGEDTARVAKWGIVLTVNGNTVFADKYAAQDATYLAAEGKYSVEAVEEGDKVVAPGTSSAQLGEDKQLTATVKGTPEVATRYTLHIADWTDIVLPKKDGYVDYTVLAQDDDGVYGYNETFDLAADYSPIKWDITVTKGQKTIGLLSTAAEFLGTSAEALAQQGVNGFSVSEAKIIMGTYAEQLAGLLEEQVSGARNAQVKVNDDGSIDLSMDFDANKEMDFTFALAWTWAFEGPMVSLTGPSAVTTFDATTVDQADTYLGNLAAGIDGIVTPEGASTVIEATLTATATQID